MHKILNAKKLFSSLAIVLLFARFTFAHTFKDISTGPGDDDKFVVVLDAGHGGDDNGARGAFSLEKNIALAIVLKLGHLMEQTQPDVKIVYTRTTDTYPALYERTAIANAVKADLFISVHCNSSPYRRVIVGYRTVKRRGKKHRVPIYKTTHVTNASGTETYVMGLKRTSEKEKAIQGSMEAVDSSDVETTENAYIVNEKNYKQNYHGFDPSRPETYILLALRSSAYLNQSITFADNIEHQFLKAGRPSREVRQKSLAVLAGTAMPAVLVETGFINNPDEERYLNSDKGQEETAECIARAIGQYKDAIRKYRSLRRPEDSSKDAVSAKAAEKPPVVYRIQLLVSDKQYSPSDAVFKNIADKVSAEPATLNNDKVYKYMTGKYSSSGAAADALETIKQIGFKDAFIVGYQNGERVAD